MNGEGKLSLEALLFSLYVALTPANQILKLDNGSTVNKYIGLAVIVVLLLNKMISGEGFYFINIKVVLPLLSWFAISTIWSINQVQTISSIISLGNYILLWLLITEKTWNKNEKRIIMYASIAMGVYIALSLINDQLSGIRRSTLTFDGSSGVDQNSLAIALSILMMMALYLMLSANSILMKALMISTCILFVTGVFCTGSRSSVISLVIGLFVYIVSYLSQTENNENGGILVFLISIGILLYLLIGRKWIINNETLIRYTSQELLLESGGSGRTDIWGMYIDILNQTIYPYIIGFGYGTAFLAFIKYKWNWAPGTHNTYLYILVSSGIVGVFLFLKFLYIHLKKCSENKDPLSIALVFIVLTAMTSLDIFTKKDFWNVLIFAQIGLGCSAGLNNGIQSVPMNKQRQYRYIK